MPGLAGVIENYGMGDPANVRLSKAPEITARDIAKNVLKTDDPNVIAGIENAARQAEKTGQIVETAVNVAGTVSQITSVGATVAGAASPKSLPRLLCRYRSGLLWSNLWATVPPRATATGCMPTTSRRPRRAGRCRTIAAKEWRALQRRAIRPEHGAVHDPRSFQKVVHQP